MSIGCQQRPEIRYETSHLRIGTGFDEPLCEGDLEHLELVIATAEAELGTELDGSVEVYVWGPDWFEHSGRWCHDYDSGCYSYANNIVYS